jgi:hypothetical protein
LPSFASRASPKAAALALVRSRAAETARTGPEVLTFTPDPMPTALRSRFHPGEDCTTRLRAEREPVA